MQNDYRLNTAAYLFIIAVNDVAVVGYFPVIIATDTYVHLVHTAIQY